MFCKIKQSTALILGQMEMNAKVDIFLPRPTYIGKNCLLKNIYTVQCTYYIVANYSIFFLLSFRVRPKVNSLESMDFLFLLMSEL